MPHSKTPQYANRYYDGHDNAQHAEFEERSAIAAHDAITGKSASDEHVAVNLVLPVCVRRPGIEPVGCEPAVESALERIEDAGHACSHAFIQCEESLRSSRDQIQE